MHRREEALTINADALGSLSLHGHIASMVYTVHMPMWMYRQVWLPSESSAPYMRGAVTEFQMFPIFLGLSIAIPKCSCWTGESVEHCDTHMSNMIQNLCLVLLSCCHSAPLLKFNVAHFAGCFRMCLHMRVWTRWASRHFTKHQTCHGMKHNAQ